MDPDDLSVGYVASVCPSHVTHSSYRRVANNDRDFEATRSSPEWSSCMKLWDLVSEASLLGKFKVFCIYKLARRALELPGDFIECGVYRGGLSLMLALMQDDVKSSKKVFMCDNFDAGLPAPDRVVDKTYNEGTMKAPMETVQDYVAQLDLQSRCVLKRGLFSETLPTLLADQRFAFAHLDADLYRSTKDALEYIYPRLVDGAPAVVDDYYDESHGVMRALNELAVTNDVVIHLSVFGQAFFIKGEAPAPSLGKTTIGDHSVYLTTDAVRQAPLFLPCLEAIIEEREEELRRLRSFVKFCREAP